MLNTRNLKDNIDFEIYMETWARASKLNVLSSRGSHMVITDGSSSLQILVW